MSNLFMMKCVLDGVKMKVWCGKGNKSRFSVQGLDDDDICIYYIAFYGSFVFISEKNLQAIFPLSLLLFSIKNVTFSSENLLI